MMTSLVETGKDHATDLVSLYCGMFFVVDANVADSGVPRISKLITKSTKSLPQPAVDRSVSAINQVPTTSVDRSCRGLRFIVLHRKAFDASSSGDLRIKKPAFGLQLDRVEAVLRKELNPTDDQPSCCWPVHCIKAMASMSGNGNAIDDAAARMKLYARGFLVSLPCVGLGLDTPRTTTTEPFKGYSCCCCCRSSTIDLRQRIIDVLDALEFNVAIDLTADSDDGTWIASVSEDHDRRLVTAESCTLRREIGSATCKTALKLVALRDDNELERFSREHPAFAERNNNVVFHRMSEVSEVLREAKNCVDEDIQNVIIELLRQMEEVTVDTERTLAPRRFPFIVIEGLDATGKSTVVASLVRRLDARQLYSPPTSIQHLRSVIDKLPSAIRRAYYSLGNYLVAETAQKMTSHKIVVLDRFWHSTAAYAIAEESLLPHDKDHWIFRWPEDLFKPTLVILLAISEEERMHRMQHRLQTTGTCLTREEQLLVHQVGKRERILEAYRRMTEPRVIEVSAEGSPEQVFQRVMGVLSAEGVNYTRDTEELLRIC